MKILFFILTFFISVTSNAQDEKTVTLVVSGQGKTQEEARQNALRSAIEQAFGTFISSKTEILGDSLLKDEIVSVSNGNIQKFEVLDEVLLPNITYASTLKATVSVGRLTTFCLSKGIKSEFKGGLFAMNIAMQELNETSEKKAFENLYTVFTDILPKCLDYKIVPSDPVNVNNKWKVKLGIYFRFNKNYDVLTSYILQFVKSICMSQSDVDSYKALNKTVYPLKLLRNSTFFGFEGLAQSELMFDTYYFRNINTYNSVISYPYSILKFIISNVKYNNSTETHDLFSYMNKYADQDNRCLITLQSNMLFYRYLDFYSETYKKYNVDRSTSIFQESGFVNQHLYVTEGGARNICFKNNSYSYDGGSTKINSDWFLEDRASKVIVPGSPIFNLHGHGHKEFLIISLSEFLSLEEIKNITEYKVELSQNK